jgi:chemotaxis protein histidine kinase CheA/DNA-binding response OmpR family regulator
LTSVKLKQGWQRHEEIIMSGQDKQVGNNDNLFEDKNDEQLSNNPDEFDDIWTEKSLDKSQQERSGKVMNSQQPTDDSQKNSNSAIPKMSNSSNEESDVPYFDWLDFSLDDDDEIKPSSNNTKKDENSSLKPEDLGTIFDLDSNNLENSKIESDSPSETADLKQEELATIFDLDLNDIEDLKVKPDSLEENASLKPEDLGTIFDLDSNNLENLTIESDLLLENYQQNLEINSFDNLEESIDLEFDRNLDSSENSLDSLDLEREIEAETQVPQIDNQFDDLDSFLNESALSFDDLESLIENDESEDASSDIGSFQETETINPKQTLAFNSVVDEFEDLESLLQEPLPAKTINIKPANRAIAPQSASDRKSAGFDQTMRVPVKTLDNLSNQIGELVVKRNRLEEDQERLRQFLDNLLSHVQSLSDVGVRMHDLYERSLLEGALMASRQASQAYSDNSRAGNSSFGTANNSQDDDLSALEMDRFTGFHLLSQDIIELIVRVRESTSDIQFLLDETDKVTQTLRQVTSELQEGINSSRMVNFGQTADRLPRAVRDISLKLDKQAELNIEGRDVSIDKMIVEHIYNPMTHLVNNAMTHGIESPEERRAKGKDAVGTINISASLQGNQTVISVSDDGAGIDPERVKAKAIEKGLIFPAQADNLSIQDVYEFLFHPGFSTKDKADDFAGRGVGMDVVRTDLRKIRGTVTIDSTIGQGTTFTIRLPLVLSISKALSCLSDRTRIAFAIDGVEDTKEFTTHDIQLNQQGLQCVPWRNSLLPFQPLSSLLSYNRQLRRGNLYGKVKDDDTLSIVILRSGTNLLAVQVDRILGEQEIVIKQIDGPVPKSPGIAGATILGDGSIMAIGDVLELIEIAQGRRGTDIGNNLWQIGGTQQAEPEVFNSEPLVLVVDDSITVRELLTLSFSKLGYRVEQARDGQEGWDKLRGGLPADMIFCDIEMPRMNGLELLSNLKKEESFKHIPVAMLTSRGAEKHRKMATDLGASAYLTKPYTEKELIDVAQRFIDLKKEQDTSVAVADPGTVSEIIPPQQIQAPPSEAKPASRNPSDLVVLIIDDSVTVRELLSMTFRKAGYHVEQARDGQEAWDKLKNGLHCDIAFCDIEMPRMNGLELLSRLQEDENLSALPIAMLTSRGAQKMKNMAAKRGAKGYFVKPYVEDTLLDAAQRMMNGEVLLESINLEDLDKAED